MGTEAIWIPAVASLIAGGVSYANTQQTNRRADQAAAAAVRNQGKVQEESDRNVNRALGDIEASDANAAREERLGQFMEQLRVNRKSGEGDEAALGIGSDAFRRGVAESARANDTAAARAAGLLATSDAAILQREREGNTYGRLNTDNNLVQRRSRGQAFIDDLRARQIRRNAGLDAAAGIISGVGSAYGANAAANSVNPYGEVTKQVPLEPVSIVY